MEEIFYNKLKNDLLPLYKNVKDAILLGEAFDEKREMYIAPINELRSALDHIFKAVSIASETQDCDYELKEAAEHMARAGYDALELLAGSLGTTIVSKVQPYDTETLTTVFPAYFTSIKPQISDIKEHIVAIRMERKPNSEQFFVAYFNEIKQLIEINKSVDRVLPSLQEYAEKRANEKLKRQIEEQKKKKKERIWMFCIGPIIGFVFGIIIALLNWWLKR